VSRWRCEGDGAAAAVRRRGARSAVDEGAVRSTAGPAVSQREPASGPGRHLLERQRTRSVSIARRY